MTDIAGGIYEKSNFSDGEQGRDGRTSCRKWWNGIKSIPFPCTLLIAAEYRDYVISLDTKTVAAGLCGKLLGIHPLIGVRNGSLAPRLVADYAELWLIWGPGFP